jgi:hypothetical protein
VKKTDRPDVVLTTHEVDELHEEECWFAEGSREVRNQDTEVFPEQRSA